MCPCNSLSEQGPEVSLGSLGWLLCSNSVVSEENAQESHLPLQPGLQTHVVQTWTQTITWAKHTDLQQEAELPSQAHARLIKWYF